MKRLRPAVDAPYGIPLKEWMPSLNAPRTLPAVVSTTGKACVPARTGRSVTTAAPIRNAELPRKRRRVQFMRLPWLACSEVPAEIRAVAARVGNGGEANPECRRIRRERLGLVV